jgi:[ribosomal protein S18]-alanine N-acetyltransferase
MEQAHLSQLIELDRLYMKYPWSSNSWKEWFDTLGGNKLLGLVLLQDEIVGFSLWQWHSGGEAELYKIVISARFQGKGAAISFWEKNLERLKNEGQHTAILEVEELNLRAISFYKKLGFNTIAKRKSFYSDGSCALSLKLLF